MQGLTAFMIVVFVVIPNIVLCCTHCNGRKRKPYSTLLNYILEKERPDLSRPEIVHVENSLASEQSLES